MRGIRLSDAPPYAGHSPTLTLCLLPKGSHSLGRAGALCPWIGWCSKMTASGACRSCGSELRAGDKFCHECAAPVTAVPVAEYKQVTAMFVDVVESMHIAAVVDAERFREIMAEVAQCAAEAARRYGGGTVEFTGDGVMVLFGAPSALEDHALRACLAALDIQNEVRRVAADVAHRDGVGVALRIGLDSGRVIAGEVGSASLGYSAVGQHVGMAQRMESVAPPGGVMLSGSTSRLVEHAVTMAEPQQVRIKGCDEPVAARRLLGIAPRHVVTGRPEAGLVGRNREIRTVAEILDQAVGGRGAVVNVAGTPGIGKSRIAREAATLAAGHGLEVLWTFCESHAAEVPFYVVAQLLRESTGVSGSDDEVARAKVNARFPGADPEDLLLFFDLLGIADPEVELPNIDPDARRRRLTDLVTTASLADRKSVLYIIEDVQWIDAVSESMLTDFLAVVPRTASMVLITSRPEYRGPLATMSGAHFIALAPLADSAITALLGDFLGSDPTTDQLRSTIADRAAGNPFFAEEMVRELVQRGVLTGQLGGYVCRADVADVTVPDTVQAAIEARIDRLTAPAKQTLYAASVVGARFGADLLRELGTDVALDELVGTELIDPVGPSRNAQYAFRHPLIRAVAYESQLRSARARWHRRLADIIEAGDPTGVEEQAPLIAEHLEAAGELRTAYGWHMRGASWSANRDLDAARLSWERARRIADALPDEHPDRLSMRIAPRTMLCATHYHGPTIQQSRNRFTELSDLCSAAGDKVSLAVGMAGLATELCYAGRSPEGSRLASEQLALLESVGEPAATMGLAFIGYANWADAGEFGELLRWSQRIIDLAGGDHAMGAGFGIGSPLAIALVWRGFGRYWVGRPGWRQDLREAVAMARRSDHPATLVAVLAWSYGWAVHYGVLQADDDAVRASEEAVRIAERTSNDVALLVSEYGLGGALLTRGAPADRRRGLELLVQARHRALHRQVGQQMVPVIDVWVAREKARCGDRAAAITAMRLAVHGFQSARRLAHDVWGTGVLVETLLAGGAEEELAEAEAEIDRLAKTPASAMRDITLLRIRTLLADGLGDGTAYRDFASRYLALARTLGLDGHIAWARSLRDPHGGRRR